MMSTSAVWPEVLGRFAWNDLPFVRAWQDPTGSELIGAGAAMLVIVGAAVAIVLLTRYRLWGALWSEWLTSLDHKKIGIMYIVIAMVMLSRALIEAVLMRMQQAAAVGSPGFLTSDHFSQLFSTHGSIMIFFMAMPFLTGLINYVMPLQIGARDMAFPMGELGRAMADRRRGGADDGQLSDRPLSRLVAGAAIRPIPASPSARMWGRTIGFGRFHWGRSALRSRASTSPAPSSNTGRRACATCGCRCSAGRACAPRS